MYTYGVPSSKPIQIQPENGFSTGKSMSLSHRNFKTGLKTSSYAELNDVTAPSIETGSSCKLSACKINQVYSGSYLEARDSTLQRVTSQSSLKLDNCTATNVKSDSYVELTQATVSEARSSSSCKITNCPNVARVFSGSYVEAFNSKLGNVASESSCKITQCNADSVKSDSYFEGTGSIIETIEASSSAKLINMQGVKLLTTKSYVEAKDSTIEKIEAETTVKAENSQINDLKAGKSVNLYATSVTGELTAKSLEGRAGKLVSVNVEGKADLVSCNVIQTLFANIINAANCTVLGEVRANSNVTIKDSEEVGSVESRKVAIINSKVLGNIDAVNLKLINTRVEGVVTTANQELLVSQCHIPKLIMKKPQACVELSTVQIHDICQRERVPHDLRQLVEYILLDKAQIEIAGNTYKVSIGDTSFTINDRRSNSGVTTNYFGNNSITSYGGGVSFSNVSIGGMSGSCNFNGMSISGSGISISGGKVRGSDGEEYPMEILNNPQKILQAYNLTAQLKEMIANEQKALEELEPAPQIVLVHGGHIEELCFETAGGIVLYESGGTVGKIIRPEGEVIQTSEGISEENKPKKICAEPPEDFVDPISLEIMRDPYRTPLGHRFDKKDIIEVMAYNKGIFICPLTRSKFTMDQLTRDDEYRAEINKWLESHIPI